MVIPKLNRHSISNILTLRYDTSQKPILPKISPANFKNNKPSLDYVEYLIEKSLKEKGNPTKIAIALSGGIDSTLILHFLRKIFPQSNLQAISVRFANSVDESSCAAKIAAHFDIKHHIVSVENYLRELPRAISIVGIPFWDLHWYYVAKKARTLAKYLASGDGGDEVFGGYTFRYRKFLTLVNINSTPLQKVKAYLDCHERDSVPDQAKVFGEKTKFSLKKIHSIFLPYFDNSLSLLNQVFLADYNGKLLYNFSLVNKKINDHFKLTGVTPLLSKELIKYSIGCSDTYKYNTKSNLGKLLLRKILSKYNLNFLVTDRKQGFSVDTSSLWETYGHKLCSNYLKNSRIGEDGWINSDWIKQHIDQKNLNVRYINKFLGLLAFEIWYRLYITKDIKSNKLLN